jgi:uncharacterized damage-inducible protein DinB
MTISPDVVQNHLEYDRWATSRILAAGEMLTSEQRLRDFGTADKSVAGTLVHLFRSERIWLQRLRGEEQTYRVPGDEGWGALSREWPALQEKWREWASVLSEEDLRRTIRYADLKGVARANPVWQVVLHVVNHSTHHRGQVAGFLRALGTVPPSLDFIAFMREKEAATV